MRHTCYQCDYKAKDKTHLIQHLKFDHEGVYYSCYQCNYLAKDISQLIQHVNFIHEGVPYPCQQCDYKAKDKTHLIHHLKLVHEVVCYSCYQCDFKAMRKGYLLVHKKHFNNFPDSCSHWNNASLLCIVIGWPRGYLTMGHTRSRLIAMHLAPCWSFHRLLFKKRIIIEIAMFVLKPWRFCWLFQISSQKSY